jgi:hypothetical protein
MIQMALSDASGNRRRLRKRSLGAKRPKNVVRGTQAGLDRAVDETTPAVGAVRTGEEAVTLSGLQCFQIFGHLVRSVATPGSVRERIVGPVVARGLGDDCVGDQRSNRLLYRGSVVNVHRARRSESHQYRAVGLVMLGVGRRDRVRLGREALPHADALLELIPDLRASVGVLFARGGALAL